MNFKSTLISTAIGMSFGATLGSMPIRAEDRPTSEGVRLHQLCDKGDQRACIRFGMLLNENRPRHEEWRRSHPEFWSFQAKRDSHAPGASADPSPAGRSGTNLPWCGVPYASTRECVYQTIGQCETDMRPLGGDCEPRN